MCFILFIESVLIMRGTLGWFGSSSVENINGFFSTIANLTKIACYKKPKLSWNWGGPRSKDQTGRDGHGKSVVTGPLGIPVMFNLKCLIKLTQKKYIMRDIRRRQDEQR